MTSSPPRGPTSKYYHLQGQAAAYTLQENTRSISGWRCPEQLRFCGQAELVGIWALWLSSCVILGKSLHFSGLKLPHVSIQGHSERAWGRHREKARETQGSDSA